MAEHRRAIAFTRAVRPTSAVRALLLGVCCFLSTDLLNSQTFSAHLQNGTGWDTESWCCEDPGSDSWSATVNGAGIEALWASLYGSQPPFLRKNGRWVSWSRTWVAPWQLSADVGGYYTTRKTATVSASGIATFKGYTYTWITLQPWEVFQREETTTVDLNTGRLTIDSEFLGCDYNHVDSRDVWNETAVLGIAMSGYEPPSPPDPPNPTVQATLGFTNPYADVIVHRRSPPLVDPVTAIGAAAADVVAADGRAAAVAVYRSNANAAVTFTVDAGSPLALSASTPDFLTSPSQGALGSLTVIMPVSCGSTTNEYCFLCLVWAKDTVISAGDRAALKFPHVTANVTATQAGATAQSSLDIAAPPLALIHGIWDDGSAWAGFRDWLWGRYPNVSHRVGFVDYREYNYRSFTDDSIQQALQIKIAGLLQTAALDGLVARGVDVVGHSMGGLTTRWFVTHPSSDLANAVHRLISVGTPHDGTALATQLLLNADTMSSPGPNVPNAICFWNGFSPCTLRKVLELRNIKVDTGVQSLVPAAGSNPIQQLNLLSNFQYQAIVGEHPLFSLTELWLNSLIGPFVKGASVASILNYQANDTIVTTASQRGAYSSDSATITGIVHTPVISPETGETHALRPADAGGAARIEGGAARVLDPQARGAEPARHDRGRRRRARIALPGPACTRTGSWRTRRDHPAARASGPTARSARSQRGKPQQCTPAPHRRRAGETRARAVKSTSSAALPLAS